MLNEYFEIAYAAATNRLCLFTGTGFSKAVSNNKAPTWQELLEELCDLLPTPEEIKESLFPKGKSAQLSLEEAAQVISIKLSAIDKNIYEEIATLIDKVDLSNDIKEIKNFFSSKSFRVITTNYDKLAEKLIGDDNRCQSITPGRPIPRFSADVKVYHVHGSVDSPKNMVVTSEDYFRFINSNSYFSRKLSTVLHENIVVILGYSLGDTNLKAIISDYKDFSKRHVIGSNIFLVSRSAVDQHIKDYYSYCYGIRVIDGLTHDTFFENLNNKIPQVKEILEHSLNHINIRDIVYQDGHFKDDFLKLNDSFYRIISSLSADGFSLNDRKVVKTLGKVIESKKALTLNNNAWEQYEHLAGWLAYLASIEIQGTSIEVPFLEATLDSMTKMRKECVKGYSWAAYTVWEKRWPTVVASNRTLIKRYIEQYSYSLDARTIVNSI